MTGRPPGATTVWLASYPKSGNTWLRALLAAVDHGDRLFTLADLGSGGQPYGLSGALSAWGLDVRWLTRAEAERVRTALIDRISPADRLAFRKTHERFRSRPAEWSDADGPPPEPFPTTATRAAIHLVRDPRDIASSLAHHFDLTARAAVERMATSSTARADPARGLGEQPWGSWSEHTRSWSGPQVPFPVHRLRYEDLHADPVGALLPVLRAVGADVDEQRLVAAIARTRIDRLQADEAERGFRERVGGSTGFFRRGEPGAWRHELPPPLVRAVEADHGDVMRLLGYEPVHDDATLAATTDALTATRRHSRTRWDRLPEHLDVEVTAGEVPEELPGALTPQPWLQIAPGRAIVSLVGGTRVEVVDGRRATVKLPPSVRASGDSGWVAQGWTVAIALLQRGHLLVHGSAVQVGDVAVCVAGRSGAGKSTTALGLRARGHRLLVDDVCALDWVGGRPYVLPYLRGVHLTPRSAEGVGVDYENLPALSAGRGKATYVAEDPGGAPVPLRTVVVVVPATDVDEVTVDEPTGADRLRVLAPHLARDGAAPVILGAAPHFALSTRLAESVRVVRLRRPARAWSLAAVLDAIEAAAVPRS